MYWKSPHHPEYQGNKPDHFTSSVFDSFVIIFGSIFLAVAFGFILHWEAESRMNRRFQMIAAPAKSSLSTKQSTKQLTKQPNTVTVSPSLPPEDFNPIYLSPELEPSISPPFVIVAPITSEMNMEQYDRWNKARMKYIEEEILPKGLPIPFTEELPAHLVPENFPREPKSSSP